MGRSNINDTSYGAYNEEALRFLREHMDKVQYDIIMSTKRGRELPYVAARVFLSDVDWRRYVWIVDHGSLDGFKED